MVSFKTNGIKRIHPDALQSQLRWLILTDNEIEEIPPEIGRCTILQKCMLSGNKIRSIPNEISACTNLELIRLASNRLTEPPMALLGIPSLKWIALSENPFLQSVAAGASHTANTPTVLTDDSLDSDQGEVLGKGASGITRKVHWNDRPVAVKTYIGTMTSDGNPQQEKALSLLASTIGSPCLIQVLGQTSGGSLVMELLHNYTALAGPPSMESCSRDVYETDQSCSLDQGMSMVSGLLLVLRDLHSKGITHGDFYGHNILVSQDDKTKVKLSDFGAAFFYEPNTEYGKLLEQIEMRAFGVLVEETVKLLQKSGTGVSVPDAIVELRTNCDRLGSFEELVQAWKTATSTQE